MSIFGRVGREIRFLRGVLRTLKRVRDIRPDSPQLVCDDLEAAVDRYRERTAIRCEGRSLTYAEMDALANRYAQWTAARRIGGKGSIALFMPNRLEYVPVWYGLSKVGIPVALINNQLSGQALVHCLQAAGARHVIVDAETAPAFEAIRERLEHPVAEWIVGGSAQRDKDLDSALKGVSSLRPDRQIARGALRARDLALYIFTSGTTGLPKAARITHMRAQMMMRGFAAATDAGAEDRIYCALPLYHATGGLGGVGAALLGGGTLVLKRRFSAADFWVDMVREDCTMFVYIGELCRYLVNQPERDEERRHKLRLAFGNGLRPDIWRRFQSRFKIPRILEFYGSTEGNVAMFNFDGRPGAVGRIPKYLRRRFNVKLVRLDIETEQPVRNAQGFCIECRVGEAGEALGEIRSDDVRATFSGYADKAETERKILRDVFARGDAWFRTGDLMRQDRDGYFYFVDRIGDTFRWRGENVSTAEVSERLSEIEGVQEANVYGVAVPGAEGRAGMAAVVTGPGFDLKAFSAQVEQALPSYAQPAFLRLQGAIETTGTFKYTKMALMQDGFDPARIQEPLYVRTAQGYVPLDAELYERILGGELRL